MLEVYCDNLKRDEIKELQHCSSIYILNIYPLIQKALKLSKKAIIGKYIKPGRN